MTGNTKSSKTGALSLAFAAAQEEMRMMISWTAPNGMFKSDVTYLLKPRPLRIRGPNTFVTDAPTLRRRDMPIQRYVFGSRASSQTWDHSKSREPIPV